MASRHFTMESQSTSRPKDVSHNDFECAPLCPRCRGLLRDMLDAVEKLRADSEIDWENVKIGGTD
jgi:hypothetical protein